MAKKNNIEAQLQKLRHLTATTGGIHEAQRLNLMQWGAIAFADMGKWTADILPDSKQLNYKIESKKKRPSNLANLIAALVRSVHWLLGTDWQVNVSQNDNLLYSSPVTPVSKENVKRKQRIGSRASSPTTD